MPTALLFGHPVAHSTGAYPRPTRPGLRALLKARPDLRVVVQSRFDGQIDGMRDVDLNLQGDDHAALLALLAQPGSGFGCYASEGLFGMCEVLQVFSHTDRMLVCEPEHLRRCEDARHLPQLPAPAHEVRSEWLRAQRLDPMAWDDAMTELREVTEADHMLSWVRTKSGIHGNAVGLACKRLENWLTQRTQQALAGGRSFDAATQW